MTQEPTIIGGRYELGSVLGRGGMAEVRRAHDSRLGREVAIKQLRADLAGDATFQARFRREAQSAAGLNHPNIVSVYDTGVSHDPDSGVEIPYIVMELVEGETLRDIIRQGRRILPERAFELTQGVLDALSYSHKAGIVHRDIKPANVMLTPTGQVKVMDFGIARAVADTAATMTQTAAVIGTAQYLSPEQARGEKVDARSDIYSAGCLLYELLTGRPPFQGDSPVSVAYQHVREAPVPPSQVDEGDPMITADMDAVVLTSLAKAADDRYQSAREMRDDISRLLGGAGVTAAVPAFPSDSDTAAMAPTQVLGAQTGPQTVVDPGSGAPERRGMHPGLVALLTVLSILALSLIGYSVFQLVSNSAPQDPEVTQVTVPDVMGKSEAEAKAALEAVKLGVKVEHQATPAEATIDQVIEQDPQGNTQADEGSTVTITINDGPETATIPEDLVGMKEADAVKALIAAGFSKDSIQTVSASTEDANLTAGQVASVNPQPGAKVTKSRVVLLEIATGKSVVPDVRNQTEVTAVDVLKGAGFPAKATYEESDAVPGTVLDQNPAAGAEWARGQVVRIVVAKAKPQPTPTLEPTTQAPEPTDPATQPGDAPTTTAPSDPPPDPDPSATTTP